MGGKLGGSAASGSTKFPKEFVKALDQRMEKVARGSDPAYSDPLLRQTIGAFYGSYAQPSFQKKMRENRQIEELILMFVTTASTVLKKRLEGTAWKQKLNEQVGSFVNLIRECLTSREMRNVQPELLNRLETYRNKLVDPNSEERALATSKSEPYRNKLELSTPIASSSAPTSRVGAIDNSMATNVKEMPLVLAVGSLFGKTTGELMKDVVALRRLCTERVSKFSETDSKFPTDMTRIQQLPGCIQ